MFIKKNDTVLILKGKDAGKTGKVLRAIPSDCKVIVEALNTIKKHQRARRGGQKGQIIDKSMPIHISNVALIDPKDKKATRIGFKEVSGKKVRVSKRSGQEI